MKSPSPRNPEQEAKDVLLLIIKASDGKFHLKTNLFKAFYYAHLYYYEATGGETLTDYPIVRMPQGPGIDNADALFTQLADKIDILKENFGPYPEYTFTFKPNVDVPVDENSLRYKAVKDAVDFVKGKQATVVSEGSHQLSRTWNLCKNGEEQNIYLDILDDGEYDKLTESQAAAKQLIDSVFQYASA